MTFVADRNARVVACAPNYCQNESMGYEVFLFTS